MKLGGKVHERKIFFNALAFKMRFVNFGWTREAGKNNSGGYALRVTYFSH